MKMFEKLLSRKHDGKNGDKNSNDKENRLKIEVDKLPSPPQSSTKPSRVKSSSTNASSVSNNMESILGFELPFDALYNLGRRLGSGSFSTVYLTEHRLSGMCFATKIINRRKIKAKDDKIVLREIGILRELHGYEGVINMVNFFESSETYHIVMDLATGGDVLKRLSKRTQYKESDSRMLATNLLNTIEFLHGKNIIHRDLKPENLLLLGYDNDWEIKVADFGFAKQMTPPQKLSTRCGTPAFVAPEVILGIPYDTKADMWSVGCILFFLLGGYPPFQAENHKELFRKIRTADYIFHDNNWRALSLEAKQLISSLLVVDPRVRFNATQALAHKWFTTLKRSDLENNCLSNSLNDIKKFNARRKLKSAGIAVRYAISAQFWKTQFCSFSQMSIYQASSMRMMDNSKSSGSPMSASSSPNVKRSFEEDFTIKSQIQVGSSGKVFLVEHNESLIEYAAKIIPRKGMKPSEDANILNEISILQSMRHKNIVKLEDFYEEKERFIIIMEYMTGGDVFDKVVELSHYTEKDARDLFRNLLQAVDYMHTRNVAHRDLKPQNLLLLSKSSFVDIKISDFGFAKHAHTPLSLVTRCGTPTYVAPEILKNHPHDTSVDLWSAGVILYVLLVGYPPFMEDNQRVLFQKIRMGIYEFDPDDWKNVSDEAQELIENLLIVDPACRISAQQALNSPWFKQDDEKLKGIDLNASVGELKKYVENDSSRYMQTYHN